MVKWIHILPEVHVTRNAMNQDSVTHYILVNERMRETVSHMWVNEKGMIDVVSDYNVLIVECMLCAEWEIRPKAKKEKWKLRDVGWEKFEVELNERSWEDESL